MSTFGSEQSPFLAYPFTLNLIVFPCLTLTSGEPCVSGGRDARGCGRGSEEHSRGGVPQGGQAQQPVPDQLLQPPRPHQQ